MNWTVFLGVLATPLGFGCLFFAYTIWWRWVSSYNYYGHFEFHPWRVIVSICIVFIAFALFAGWVA